MSARTRLVRLLQLAYSGELAAAHAYRGHALSVRDPSERAEIAKIEEEELEHRRCVGSMLEGLGAAADPRRERLMNLVGLGISAFCRVGGWYVPMYGAGRLESKNVGEYEEAARLAFNSGQHELIEALLHMAEVEWDHEAYFRAKCASHWLDRFFPKWVRPPPRLEVRASFERFIAAAPSPLQLTG